MMRTAAFCALVAAAAADLTISRSVTQIEDGASVKLNIGPAGTCTGSDMYGSNDCTMQWGKNYTAAGETKLPAAVGEGSKLDVALKLDGLFPFAFTCDACGEGKTCDFTVPIVGQKVSIALPPCPLFPAGDFKKDVVLPVPEKSPAGPLKISAAGTVTVKDGSGASVIVLSVNGKLAP